MARIATASSSQLAADAAARIAQEGGNAVDGAVAAALVSVLTEPGVCALGGGGFVTIWTPGFDPVTIDGYVEMPGRGLPRERFGKGVFDVTMEYGGGITTTIGHGSTGTPGTLAALGLASTRYGRLPWPLLVEPALDLARAGFPLSQASNEYLQYSHEVVFGWQEPSRAALHREDGSLIPLGGLIQIADRVDTIRAIAEQGPRAAFYEGEIARLIAADMEANGGLVTAEDLAEYQPLVRRPLEAVVGGWHIVTNPAPAIGGITLTAMLMLMNGYPKDHWSVADYDRLVKTQIAVLGFRRDQLDFSNDLPRDAQRLLAAAEGGDLEALMQSPSTVHTSTVDSTGAACSVTISAGYGSGVMPPGTGIWMNNCLGEIELNRRGFHALAPGTRLTSNMAPTIARHEDGRILSVGSPGAARITTAILATVLNFTELGMSLTDAIAAPRVHVESDEETGWQVAYEGSLPIDQLGYSHRRFETLDMYFGGVGAAYWDSHGDLEAAADPRRAGGTSLAGSG
jgi:gamma-glutamyltranspeptidase/glutathione hydrolase